MIAFMTRGETAIVNSSKTDEIAFFWFSRKAIAFLLHSAQVRAISTPS
jgi:hypothetical protein